MGQAADVEGMFSAGGSSFASMLLGGQEAQDDEEGLPEAGSFMLSDDIGPFDHVQPTYEPPADSLWSAHERPSAPGGTMQHPGPEAAGGWGQQVPSGLGQGLGGIDQLAGWGQHPGPGPVQWSSQA